MFDKIKKWFTTKDSRDSSHLQWTGHSWKNELPDTPKLPSTPPSAPPNRRRPEPTKAGIRKKIY